MSHTDPIADMLSRINNALVIKGEEVEVPHSRTKEEIARILADEGFIAGYVKKENGVLKNLVLRLKYGPDRERVISGVKRISKPGLRVYERKEDLPQVLGGLGIAVISTSQGIMTDKEARKKGVGGEVLCYIW